MSATKVAKSCYGGSKVGWCKRRPRPSATKVARVLRVMEIAKAKGCMRQQELEFQRKLLEAARGSIVVMESAQGGKLEPS